MHRGFEIATPFPPLRANILFQGHLENILWISSYSTICCFMCFVLVLWLLPHSSKDSLEDGVAVQYLCQPLESRDRDMIARPCCG